jgi:hypothetical protein
MAAPTQPAPGANFDYGIPLGRVGRLYGMWIKHVNSAVVIGRYLHVEMGDYVAPFNATNLFDLVPQSQTANYVFLPGVTQATSGNPRYGRLPKQPLLIPNYGTGVDGRIRTTLFNIQAADQITVAWRYKERPI